MHLAVVDVGANAPLVVDVGANAPLVVVDVGEFAWLSRGCGCGCGCGYGCEQSSLHEIVRRGGEIQEISLPDFHAAINNPETPPHLRYPWKDADKQRISTVPSLASAASEETQIRHGGGVHGGCNKLQSKSPPVP